ncbi:zinc finger Ran-binding domain-containing protein 2-like [Centruroides sculpturatus]|uniref:zinc finger Ran-binding domain-containing protein 2-like n=1 Tax=Centruroides sculpturatus TaxID=218467 RepID=UPI000C6DA4C4|nr:zinc finger Ran-binding domain-containing protein 2-like [Centruroides sculpturatus]
MGTLRRRLSLRKTRSKSMEQKADKDETRHPSSRSVSADRSRSMPESRETSSLRSSGGSRTENDSTRSSISEASGISSSSTRTYLSDKSTLVVEANENGVIKRYLIPTSLANRSKWRKKGVKLHVYNDHVFVAKHFSGLITCQVCNRHLSRRPGKQGYECRVQLTLKK